MVTELSGAQFVQEIDLFEKQLGINCTREQIGLFIFH